MKINPQNINLSNINTLFASLMIEQLILRGADYFCLAPGSRSTPLAVSVAEHPKAKVRIHFDERGAGFYALGVSRATGRPAMLIVTSGTAVANLLPAVVEASMSNTPMILLTADRPPELRGTGANQTIDQREIFGNFTRQFVDLPCPDIINRPSVIIELIDQAVKVATGINSGPVHINCMFREPLAPIDDGVDYSAYLTEIINTKQTDSLTTNSKPNDSDLDKVNSIINNANCGLIVIGSLDQTTETESIIAVANRLSWPVLCDITSGLRFGNELKTQVIYYDQLLLSEITHPLLIPDCCLHLGGVITSKRLITALGQWRPDNYLQIKHGELPFDPNRQITTLIAHNPNSFCEKLLSSVKQNDNSEQLTKLVDLSTAVDSTIEQTLTKSTKLSEPQVARMVSKLLTNNHNLFLASSLSIREIDMFAHPGSHKTKIGANRGASGIDGTIATAAGFATGLKQPVTLLIGDLAMLHDLNSLALLPDNDQPVIIIILNNNGGRIFEKLPIAKFNKVIEKFFVTPHGLEFKAAATMFGLPYTRVEKTANFNETYQKHISGGKSSVIEIIIDSNYSTTVHNELTERIKTTIEKESS